MGNKHDRGAVVTAVTRKIDLKKIPSVSSFAAEGFRNDFHRLLNAVFVADKTDFKSRSGGKIAVLAEHTECEFLTCQAREVQARRSPCLGVSGTVTAHHRRPGEWSGFGLVAVCAGRPCRYRRRQPGRRCHLIEIAFGNRQLVRTAHDHARVDSVGRASSCRSLD